MRKKKVEGAGEFNDEMLNEAEPGSPTSPKVYDAPDQNVQRAELQDKIKTAINSLSEDHREVILLKEVEGLSYQERGMYVADLYRLVIEHPEWIDDTLEKEMIADGRLRAGHDKGRIYKIFPESVKWGCYER